MRNIELFGQTLDLDNLQSAYLNGDCMAGMKQFPDKYFDLAVVDPPYGINASNMNMGANLNRKDNPSKSAQSTAVRIQKGRLNSGGGKLKNRKLNNSNCDWDYKPPTPEYFEELFRVSKNQIIWGGNYFDLPPTRCVICWDKKQPWETFSQWEMAWTSFDKPAALFSYSTTAGNHGEKDWKIHPTQKPVQLYAWLFEKYAEPGMKILDTHVGSASSLIAARDAGLTYIGFELDEYYYNLSKKRLDQHTAQMNLYDFGINND